MSGGVRRVKIAFIIFNRSGVVLARFVSQLTYARRDAPTPRAFSMRCFVNYNNYNRFISAAEFKIVQVYTKQAEMI